MALTALDIQQQSFGTSRHGYDPQEVDVFLERVALEVDNFNRALIEARNRFEAAEARAQAAEQMAIQAQQVADQKAAEIVVQQPVVAAPSEGGVTEEQISRAFIAAQRSADALKEEARAEAEKTYREAEQRAREVVRDATAEKQRILVEIDRLRESCEKFRSEYLSLINHFSADAKKVMPTIEAAVPDTAEAKASLADYVFIAQNDAVAAPPQAVAAPAQEVFVAAPAAAPAAPEAIAAPQAEPAAAEPAAAEQVGAAPAQAAAAPVQAGIDFDDDLDIDEID